MALPRQKLHNPYGSVSVYTRAHLAPCRLTDSNDVSCDCPKWLYIHEANGRRERLSARTGNFQQAWMEAREIVDDFDPTLRELKQLRAARTRQSLSVSDAIEQYLDNKRAMRKNTRYVRNLTNILARRPQKNKRLSRHISLLAYVERLNLQRQPAERIQTIDQIDADLLTQWRLSWQTNDLSSHHYWLYVKSFFRWLVDTHKLTLNPATPLRAEKVRSGNRCGSLDDKQYEKLLAACRHYRPSRRMSDANQEVLPVRLHALMQLMRWGGMSLIDVIHFRQKFLSSDGVLSYQRKKNSQLAHGAVMPRKVVEEIRRVPLDPASPDPERPFFYHGDAQSRWAYHFYRVAELARLGKVTVDVGGERPIHPHMLRDTFAVWHLTHGTPLESVSRMLGHATTVMTQRAYLPFVESIKNRITEDARATLRRAGVV